MTLAAITMTAPEAASPVQMYRATYSPDDNKLRLYAVSRLDRRRIKKCMMPVSLGTKTGAVCRASLDTGREDVLLSLAGEIEDEDSTLLNVRKHRRSGLPDTAESGPVNPHRHDEVERLAAMIRPVSPFLWGIANAAPVVDAQRIENGMKRAVMLFERAEYWEERARSALLHARYKNVGRSLASYQKNRS